MENAGKIAAAMCGGMADIGAIGKDDYNQMQKFKFRGIDAVYNELHSVLAKHKVFSLPLVLDERTEERTSRNGAALIYRVLKVKYVFYADDGSSVDCVVIGEGMDSGDKAANKAMAVAHKYALLQAFCIPTDEQKDPDAESHEVKPKQPKTIGGNYALDLETEIADTLGDGAKTYRDNLLSHYGINDLSQLTYDQYKVVTQNISKKKLEAKK